MVWNGMERKFWYGIWKMPEWNGMEVNLPYFHTNSILYFVHCIYRKTYTVRMSGMINNIFAEVLHFNIYAHYLWTNRGTLIVFIAQTVYALHRSKCVAICSIDAMVDDFDRFALFVFLFRDRHFPKLYLCFSSIPTKVRICYFIPVSS